MGPTKSLSFSRGPKDCHDMFFQSTSGKGYGYETEVKKLMLQFSNVSEFLNWSCLHLVDDLA